MPTPFRTTRRVEFADTDMAGIMHFANFFRYMEAAEVEFLRSLGLSVRLGWEGQELGFPRVSASCDYQKPARFEDLLEITVRIMKIGAKSITYGFEFFSKEALLARGQVSSVCCTILPNREIASLEIPASLRKILEAANQ
jgi:YbgC/YbaW family acyl-CoA thioester hydrolase